MGVQFGGLRPRRPQYHWYKRRLLFVGTSTMFLALGVLTALLVSNYSDVQARPEIVSAPPIDSESAFDTVVLIAPSAQIARGSKLSAAQLRQIHWPRDKVPEGAVLSMEEAQDMFAIAPLPADMPIVRKNISLNSPASGIGELLPAGHRAVTIQVNAVSGIEGWATPGSHVDVYLTFLDSHEGVYKTRVAVEDAVVLSYGGKPKKVNNYEEERPDVAATVTLAVPFEESLKIQTAIKMGTITLALRNNTDLSSQGNAEFSANDWDKRPVRQKADEPVKPKGFASYTDTTGSEKQFVLGGDERWWSHQSDEEG